MKLLSFDGDAGVRRVGVLQGEAVVDVSDLVATMPIVTARSGMFAARGIETATGGLMRWLQAGPQARAAAAESIGKRLAQGPQHGAKALGSLVLRAPLARPGKIVAVGRNYADHAKETGVKPFEKPRIIFKLPSSIADPGATVARPALVQKFDFEGELAVVIGEFASNVSVDEALRHVAGYTVLNDLSAREFQFDINPAQTTFAKSMDGFCPLGPWLVTADEIPDPQQLRLRTWVNEVLVQQASTADMLFTVAVLVSYVSQFMTLEPGDVLATGTPAGIGAFRTPPQWLQPGDRIRIDISGIGALETTIG